MARCSRHRRILNTSPAPPPPLLQQCSLTAFAALTLLHSRAAQLIIGTLVAAIVLFLQVQAAPYNDISNDHLAAASSFSLLILFLSCICFKYAAAFELPDIQERMSKEQELTYFVDTGLLALIVIASILSTLVAAVVLFLAQLGEEGRRMRREALARKARRLRYKEGDAECQPPDIAAEHFHIFLSHVWGTGQDQVPPRVNASLPPRPRS